MKCADPSSAHYQAGEEIKAQRASVSAASHELWT